MGPGPAAQSAFDGVMALQDPLHSTEPELVIPHAFGDEVHAEPADGLQEDGGGGVEGGVHPPVYVISPVQLLRVYEAVPSVYPLGMPYEPLYAAHEAVPVVVVQEGAGGGTQVVSQMVIHAFDGVVPVYATGSPNASQ